MYQEIKRLADEAIALQNKLQMEAALRQISALCVPGAVMLVDGEYKTTVPPMAAEQPEAKPSAKFEEDLAHGRAVLAEHGEMRKAQAAAKKGAKK
jgi:hypothetical protein